MANFELFPAFWFSLAMCDPTSYPYNPCTPNSDANDPLTAGSALLEVQFYPPGSNGCSTTQWCAALTIDSLHDNNPTVKANCFEPITSAYLTTNGAPNGSRVLMSNGHDIVLTIKDTTNGLSVAVTDNTSGATGSMVASAANQFFHNANTTDCTTEPFTFHPEYSTASFTHLVPWTSLGAGVAVAMEIGHWELCGDASCNTKPDGNDEGVCSVSNSECILNTDCPAGETCIGTCFAATIRGIGGCTNKDADRDGVSYQAKWADGTSSHPASIIIGSPNNKGIGPQSVSPSNPSVYSKGYNGMKFKTTESTAGVSFYPFYSRSGSGAGCRLNFGNDVPGVTKSDFGKAAQYGTLIPNPCSPDLAWLVPVRARQL